MTFPNVKNDEGQKPSEGDPEGVGKGGPGEGVSCVLWGRGGRRGLGNPNIGQTQILALNIKTRILVNLPKMLVCPSLFCPNWPKLVWPNLVLATGLAKVGHSL